MTTADTKAPLPSDNLDRRQELVDIYERSGLKELFESKGLVFFPKERYSKLKFVANEFGISAIELYPLLKDEPYFRIHYRPRVPQWLKDEFKTWPTFRGDNEVGSNFYGDPMSCARALAQLLAQRR